jgi:hypothetical protein
MSGNTLIELANNPTSWDEFCGKGLVSASGTNANLKDLFMKLSKLEASSN